MGIVAPDRRGTSEHYFKIRQLYPLILYICTPIACSVMKTPRKGYTKITVSDALKDQLKCIAEAEGLSMPGLIKKMLGALYPEHPDPVGAGEEREMIEIETDYRALAHNILVVAKQGELGSDWAAYIGTVPGNNYDAEWRYVANHGAKLPYDVAKVLFPGFDKKYEWRP